MSVGQHPRWVFLVTLLHIQPGPLGPLGTIAGKSAGTKGAGGKKCERDFARSCADGSAGQRQRGCWRPANERRLGTEETRGGEAGVWYLPP